MFRLLPILFALTALTLIACTEPEAPRAAPESLNTESVATPAAAVAQDALPKMTVYKTPTCGCCKKWVAHLEENGFTVEAVDLPSLTDVKRQYGIPASLQSCHTGVVDGYVVEGHVPAEDVKRLLEERPEAGGLSVPGMPIGSPGMEVPGRPADAYDVYLIKDGKASVYASH